MLTHGVEQARGRVYVGQVGLDGQRSSTGLTQLVGQGISLCRGAAPGHGSVIGAIVAGGHIPTILGQRARDGCSDADATAGARDEGNRST